MKYHDDLTRRHHSFSENPGARKWPAVAPVMPPLREASVRSLEFTMLNCAVQVDCMDERAVSLLLQSYGPPSKPTKRAPLYYRISRDRTSRALAIVRHGVSPIVASDDGEFLCLFDKDMVTEVQKQRPDLYFIHAAALELHGRAILLVGSSGCGKSTTAWGLLQHGFSYLSDEMAAMDLPRVEVCPYAHALRLKGAPPAGYRLPEQALYTETTIQVPAAHLPGRIVAEPTPLKAIFFLKRQKHLRSPSLAPMSRAEAIGRLFANALNPLAHTGDGLDGAIQIVRNSSCFELTVGELSATCRLIKNTLTGLRGNSRYH